MRLFIGFRLPAPALEGVKEFMGFAGPYFGRSVTWAAPENLHVTCAFLGEVSAGTRLACIKRRVDGAAGSFREIGLTLGGLGAFPDLERPRVLWLGFTEGADELKALALHLACGLEREGFALQGEFFPHVTLGRVKAPLGGEALAAVASKAGGLGLHYAAASLEVIESRPSNAGADYRTLHSGRLL